MDTCNFEQDLTLIERYHLIPNELFILKILFLAQVEGDDYIDQFICSCDENKTIFRDNLITLQEKGIILKSYNFPNIGEKIFPYDIPINKYVFKNLIKASEQLGQELYDIYPDSAIIDGVVIYIKAVSRKFNTLNHAFRFYGKSIGYNIELHNHIKELVLWAKENTHLINCTLASFIIDRRWEFIEKVKQGQIGNVNFDTVRML